MAAISKKHGMEMFQSGDKTHLDTMDSMKELMNQPGDLKAWFEKKHREFDALSEHD